MAFGIDDIFFALMAASTANNLVNPPKGPQNTIPAGSAAPQASQGANAFALPMPNQLNQNMPAVEIDDELFTAAAQQAAAVTQGPPPTVPLAAPANAPVGPPQDPNAGTLPPQPGAAPPTSANAPGIGEILAASPQAIASVANLLGLGPSEGRRETPAPIPGGTAGNIVQGFNLPQNLNIGSILSQIPRFR